MSQTVVGKLNKAFGIKGFIKVIPDSAFAEDLKNNDVWFVQRGKDLIPYFVESISHDPHFLVKFEDVDSPETAKDITGCSILLRDKDIAIQTAEDDSDLDKLVNFIVENEGEVIGSISRIEEFPQQLMAFVEHKNMEIMMPLTPHFIIDIDIESKRLSVELPKGFLESQL